MDVTPGSATLGREWVSFDPASASATLRFRARPDFGNRHGTVQGGFLAAMLDSATGITLLATLPQELTAVTISLNTRFERPAPIGALTVKARVVEKDERDATVEAEVMSPDDTIVARGRAKLRIRKRQPV
ncbi:MAG TPA: PaaI family thioesterase [Bradyrhizobium sp.]|uniref:PaaI family thioesterase n=1 Tax=Bradyrhizobium sp. TaxID=376 RepID=UPI002BA9FC2F|nr:PaaI family thioesterase [Bradyrhizobium sp.]HLZ06876.1 PaaI family thioesterase [Bradyrhizobium sp.]